MSIAHRQLVYEAFFQSGRPARELLLSLMLLLLLLQVQLHEEHTPNNCSCALLLLRQHNQASLHLARSCNLVKSLRVFFFIWGRGITVIEMSLNWINTATSYPTLNSATLCCKHTAPCLCLAAAAAAAVDVCLLGGGDLRKWN